MNDFEIASKNKKPSEEKSINLRDRYEHLLYKINSEFQKESKSSLNYNIKNNESLEDTISPNVSTSKKEGKSNTSKSGKHSRIQKEESVDDFIQKILSELSHWNDTWEKCILLASKVIKYHAVSPQSTDQQRAILIDVVQRLCKTIIDETRIGNENINVAKFNELAEKRKKDKKRLKKMQKRCENLYVEVQKNREMIQSIENGQNKGEILNENQSLSRDKFFVALANKHNEAKFDQMKILENEKNRKIRQIKNDEKCKNGEKCKSELKNYDEKNRKNFNSVSSSSYCSHFVNQFSDQSSDSFDTKDSINYTNKVSFGDANSQASSDDDTSDSVLYSNFEASHSNQRLDNSKDVFSDRREKGGNQAIENRLSNDFGKRKKVGRPLNKSKTASSDRIETTENQTGENRFSHDLSKMIRLVNNLEIGCSKMETNLNDQISAVSKVQNKIEMNRFSSRNSSGMKNNQTRISGNDLSLDSLEKMHISLVEAERNYSNFFVEEEEDD